METNGETPGICVQTRRNARAFRRLPAALDQVITPFCPRRYLPKRGHGTGRAPRSGSVEAFNLVGILGLHIGAPHFHGGGHLIIVVVQFLGQQMEAPDMTDLRKLGIGLSDLITDQGTHAIKRDAL